MSVHAINDVINVITQVRKFKSEHQLSLKTELNILRIFSQQKEQLGLLKMQEQLIKGITHAHAVEYQVGLHENGSQLIQENENRTLNVQL